MAVFCRGGGGAWIGEKSTLYALEKMVVVMGSTLYPRSRGDISCPLTIHDAET